MPKKRFKYFIFYTRSDLELYAYTPDKKTADIFRMVRDMDKFYEKEVKCTSSELKDIFDLHAFSLLRMEGFEYDDLVLEFPITTGESTAITNFSIYQVYTSMPCSATIPPQIFNKKIQNFLDNIGYTEAHDYYYNGGSEYNPKINKFNIFIYLYSDTLNFKKGDGIIEALHVLSNRSLFDK